MSHNITRGPHGSQTILLLSGYVIRLILLLLFWLFHSL